MSKSNFEKRGADSKIFGVWVTLGTIRNSVRFVFS